MVAPSSTTSGIRSRGDVGAVGTVGSFGSVGGAGVAVRRLCGSFFPQCAQCPASSLFSFAQNGQKRIGRQSIPRARAVQPALPLSAHL
jgi:hypothetical protein